MAVTPSWHPGSWKAGQAARWRGIQIVCCGDHTLPHGAKHPWDASVKYPHLLWAPNGVEQCAALRRLVIDNRETLDARTRGLLLLAAADGGSGEMAA